MLFAINKTTGVIDTNTPDNIPGLEALDHADELAGVVVIRIYANKDLDIAMNVDPYACQGILAKAQQYLFMKGM